MATPRGMTWQGRHLTITAVGRRWQADNGLHLLVRVADGRVFELHVREADTLARLRSTPFGVI